MSQLTPDETLLGLLAASPQHGYQLLDHFHDRSKLGEVWDLSTSQLYAVLKRLADRGWIVGREVQSADAPNRTEYHVTAMGSEILDIWLHEPDPPASVRRVRVDFLSRLYIAKLLALPTADIVMYQRDSCARKMKELTGQRGQFKPGVALSALDLLIAQLEAILQWIEKLNFE